MARTNHDNPARPARHPWRACVWAARRLGPRFSRAWEVTRRGLGDFFHAFIAWPPLGAIMAVTLLSQVAYAIITPTLPLYLSSARFHTPIKAIGLIFAAYAVTETLFKAVGGALGPHPCANFAAYHISPSRAG